tara:strand:- start:865 stop:1239 length:375 start_codon:yes stop_codon:yes gene_type:complete
MATKVSETVEATALGGDELILIVDTPTTNAVSKHITVNNFINSIVVSNGVNIDAESNGNVLTISTNTNPTFEKLNLLPFATPSNSSYVNATFTYKRGDVWPDATYLYVAVSNTEIRRVSLSVIP